MPIQLQLGVCALPPLRYGSASEAGKVSEYSTCCEPILSLIVCLVERKEILLTQIGFKVE